MPYPPSGSVRRRAQEVHRQIIGHAEPEQLVSHFPQAGQNVVAATMLLRNMPEPSSSQARRIRDEVQTLLQLAAVQQAKSSASRRRGAVGMEMRKSAATAHIAVGGTTAMRTGWPPSHQAHGCSAGQSAARPCPVRSDPRPASQRTTVKPNQSCGWPILGWPVS